MKRIKLLPLMALVVFSLAACGGGKSTATGKAALFDESAPSDFQAMQQFLQTKDYLGSIGVKFDETKEVRFRDGKFISNDQALADSVNAILGTDVKKRLKRGASRRGETATSTLRSQLRREKGVQISDWNSYFVIEAKDPKTAYELIMALRELDGVTYVEPKRRAYLMSAGLPSDPLFTDQSYFQGDVDGVRGLNIEGAWAVDETITGANVSILDMEGDWNFTHEDLPISESNIVAEINTLPLTGEEKEQAMNHGTAMLGILSGKWNGTGIAGIAPESNIKLLRFPHSVEPYLLLTDNPNSYNDPSDENGDGILWKITPSSLIQKGDVLLISQGSGNKFLIENTSACKLASSPAEFGTAGCVPFEASKDGWEAVRDLTALGAIVVEGAGNSKIDLDSEYGSAYAGEGPTYTEPDHDSGAIIVGASDPTTGERAPFSNCGSRIDVHGWGFSVVSAGYGDLSGSGDTAYTALFSGTSSASAMVAGVAALVQSYTKKLYNDGDTVTNADGTFVKRAFFDSKQMRELLKATGHAAVNDGDCPIGMLPDAAAAIQAVASGAFEPTIELYYNGTLMKSWNYSKSSEPTQQAIGGYEPMRSKKYDIDGDGRADLIRLEFNTWTVDLSSNNFGSDDLTFEFSDGNELSTMVFPAVADYNSDGLADLGMYDSLTGLYYIRYTDASLLAGNWNDWSRVIDYNALPGAQPYMRPVPGYYDADEVKCDKTITTDDPRCEESDGWEIFDNNWLDVAFQGPDGTWWIDYGKRDFEILTSIDTIAWDATFENGNIKGKLIIDSTSGNDTSVSGFYKDYLGFDNTWGNVGFDQEVDYLSYLDDAFGAEVAAQLKEAVPGWAFLGVGVEYIGGKMSIMYSLPDAAIAPDKTGVVIEELFVNKMGNDDYYGNQNVIVPGDYEYNSTYSDGIGIKNSEGSWSYNYTDPDLLYDAPVATTPSTGFGSLQCRPIPADYDGDGIDDPATLCPNEWRIAYSGEEFAALESNGLHSFQFEFDSAWTLPAYVFPGGISYEDVVSIYNTYSPKLANWFDHFDSYQQPTEIMGISVPLDKLKISEIWPNWCKNWQCEMATNGKPFPPAIGPHMAQCIELWPSNPIYCWDK